MVKTKKIVAVLISFITVVLAFIPYTTFGYNSDYLSNPTWIESKSTISKAIKSDKLSCSISYIIENNVLYVQISASSENITNDTFCEIVANSNGYDYKFKIDSDGLATDNQDIKKIYEIGAKFSTSTSVKVGNYLFAIEPNTKSADIISIYLWIGNQRYEIMDNIIIPATTTTKPTTTKPQGKAETTLIAKIEETTSLPIITEEKGSKKEDGTKFSPSHKYTTKKNSAKNKAEKTTQFEPQSIPADYERQVPEYKAPKNIKSTKPNKSLIIISGIIGMIGFMVIGYSIAKLTEKKPKEEKEKSLEEIDDFEF